MVRGLESIPMHNVVDAAFADIHGFGNCTKFIVMQTCCRFFCCEKRGLEVETRNINAKLFPVVLMQLVL